MTRSQTRPAHRGFTDPMEDTCPVCHKPPGKACIGVDFRALPSPHEERGAEAPLYDALATAHG